MTYTLTEDMVALPTGAWAGAHRRTLRNGERPVLALSQGKHGSQPELQTPGHGIVAGFGDVGDIARQMGQAGLMLGGMALLGSVAVRDPHRGPVAVHHLPHHDSAPCRGGRVHDGVRRMEDPCVDGPCGASGK